MLSKIASVILGILFVALIAWVNAYYFEKFEPEFVTTETGGKATLVEISAVVDRIVTMLMALSLGTFILAGFGVKIILDRKKTAGWFSKVSLAGFVTMQILSLSFGYSANMSMLQNVSKNFSSSDSMQNYLSHQAFFLVCGLGCLIAAAAHFLFDCSPTPVAQEAVGGDTTNNTIPGHIPPPSSGSPNQSKVLSKEMPSTDAKDRKTEPRKK